MLLTPMELGALPKGTLIKATHREVRALVYIMELWTDDNACSPAGSVRQLDRAMTAMSWQQLVHCPRLAGKYVFGHAWVNGKRSYNAQNFHHAKYTFERLTLCEEEEIALMVLARL
jgi:hypothetical protein